jgi:ABC-2 type transport system permease protein
VRRTLHAEWTKLRTMPSTIWLLLAAVGFTIAGSTAVTAAVNVRECPTAVTCFEDTTKLSLTGVRVGQIAVVVLAVLAMSNEYGTRMIQTTLIAKPCRMTVLVGKLTAVTAMALGAATLGVLGSVLAARSILPGNGFTVTNGYPPLSLADATTVRAAGGTVLYLALIAVLSVGVATVVRDTAGAITAILAVLFLSPMVSQFVTSPAWQHRLQRFSPMNAGLAIQATKGLAGMPIGPWAGLGVLAAYAAAAAVAGAVVFQFRDA